MAYLYPADQDYDQDEMIYLREAEEKANSLLKIMDASDEYEDDDEE